MELETGGWRGGACCEWPVPLPGAMVRWQPEPPLRAMSGSMVMQGWVLLSVAHITIREHGMSLVRADVQELGRTGPAPHWLPPSGELAPITHQQRWGEQALHHTQAAQWSWPCGCEVWMSRS